MSQSFVGTLRRFGALAAIAAAAGLGACNDDPVTTEPNAEGIAVILNSESRTLTLAPIQGTGATRTVQLGPQGTPTSVATRGIRAVVPMGIYPFAVVANLLTGQVEHTIALPAGSGATGVAWVNDSIAVVANSNLNTVTPVNALRGTAGAAIPVGDYPQYIHSFNGRLFVLNAHLDDQTFQPTQNGTVTVLSSNLTLLETIELSGRNPISATTQGQNVYVLNAGDFGQANGSVSVVDALSLTEIGHVTGFGTFPTSIAFSPGTFELFVVMNNGLVVYNPSTGTFSDTPATPYRPGQAGPYSAVGFDYFGRLHVTRPGNCTSPGDELRLSNRTTVERTITTGVCPVAVTFAILPLEQN